MRVLQTFVDIEVWEDRKGRTVYTSTPFDPPTVGAELHFVQWPYDLNPHSYQGKKVTINWVVPHGIPDALTNRTPEQRDTWRGIRGASC